MVIRLVELHADKTMATAQAATVVRKIVFMILVFRQVLMLARTALDFLIKAKQKSREGGI
jgi:hypothetical protein